MDARNQSIFSIVAAAAVAAATVFAREKDAN
jgi:hypothetical protein